MATNLGLESLLLFSQNNLHIQLIRVNSLLIRLLVNIVKDGEIGGYVGSVCSKTHKRL